MTRLPSLLRDKHACSTDREAQCLFLVGLGRWSSLNVDTPLSARLRDLGPPFTLSHLGIRRLDAMEVPTAVTNASSYLPSPPDFILGFLAKASSLGDLLWSGQSSIAQPTKADVLNSTVVTTAGQFVQQSVAAAASGVAAAPEEISIFQALKNVASFFSYITSKWAIATFAIVSDVLRSVPTPLTRTGNYPEPNTILRFKPRAAVLRSPAHTIRHIHRAPAPLSPPDTMCPSSDAMSDFTWLV
jgi:hypothetical protein